MFNGFKICLNIFPHEVKKSSPDKIYQWYDFDLKIVRIIYEPETGNYLTEKLLKHWIEPLDKIDFTGDIIFHPITDILPLFENEIINLSKIIDSL